MSTIKFGTDGWRGVIAEDFTFPNVRRVTAGTIAFQAWEVLTEAR
jgi:phosphomannomutase